MSERTYNNSGIIYRNTRKQEGDRQPDCRGTATVDGKKYRISGWLKTGAKGRFASLVFQPEHPQPPQQQASTTDAADSHPESGSNQIF